MPKLVDHEERRKQIALATWRVISNLGMKGATVRNIAQEAGLSLGSLRHYFSTQEELLAFAMNLVKDQATARIEETARCNLPPKERILKILLELVPVDENKMLEMEVWFAFTFHARNKEEGFDVHHDGIFKGIGRIIHSMAQSNLLKNDADKDMETERLYALINGIALHALLEPQRMTKERIVQVLTYHLDTICVESSIHYS